MNLNFVFKSVWVFATMLQACVLVLGVRRRLHRELPWFFVYTLWEVLRSTTEFVMLRYSYSAASYFFWETEVVDALLTIAVVRELYEKTFAGYESLRGLSQTVFLSSLGALSIFCALTDYLAPGNAIGRLMTTLIVMERSVAVLIGGLLVGLLLLARWTGISWRNRTVGFALGFVIYSLVYATAATVRAVGFSSVDQLVYSIVNSAGYAVGVGIWIVYAIRRTAEVRVENNEGETALLQRWNQSMEAVIQTK